MYDIYYFDTFEIVRKQSSNLNFRAELFKAGSRETKVRVKSVFRNNNKILHQE